MFENLPELQRKDRELPLEACKEILQNAEYMVMATVNKTGNKTGDKNAVPYAVPLSFVFFENKIYFHSGMRKGHKTANLAENPYCSLAVVGKTQPVYAKNFTTYYESVVVFGSVREVTDSAKKKAVLFALAEKYLPGHMHNAEKDITASLERTAVYEISLDKITGKAKQALKEA